MIVVPVLFINVGFSFNWFSSLDIVCQFLEINNLLIYAVLSSSYTYSFLFFLSVTPSTHEVLVVLWKFTGNYGSNSSVFW